MRIRNNVEVLLETTTIIKRALQKIQNGEVGRVLGLLKPEKVYVRPTHDLLCNCRSCVVSIKTYVKRLKEN